MSPEVPATQEMVDRWPMRHMAHSCVAFWPENAPKSPQCDAVLAQCDVEIALIAKKTASAKAYV
jgi:hypothetical protein